jgi:hypothetical protein
MDRKTDLEIMQAGFRAIFDTMGVIDAERFITLIKRENFDYTEWQRNLWPEETVESLSRKAQEHWQRKQA